MLIDKIRTQQSLELRSWHSALEGIQTQWTKCLMVDYSTNVSLVERRKLHIHSSCMNSACICTGDLLLLLCLESNTVRTSAAHLTKWIICTLRHLPLKGTVTSKNQVGLIKSHWKWHHPTNRTVTANNPILHLFWHIRLRKIYWNLEIRGRSHSSSSKLAPFDSLPMVSY